MNNEKFLELLCIILALLIGALLHTIHLLRQDNKVLLKKFNFSERFLNVLFTFLHNDGVDVNKYTDITMKTLNKKGGGEHDE